jgi:hypothetical protein
VNLWRLAPTGSAQAISAPLMGWMRQLPAPVRLDVRHKFDVDPGGRGSACPRLARRPITGVDLEFAWKTGLLEQHPTTAERHLEALDQVNHEAGATEAKRPNSKAELFGSPSVHRCRHPNSSPRLLVWSPVPADA